MRWGGMPEMTFEWALRQNNIDPKTIYNVSVIYNISVTSLIIFLGIHFFTTFAPFTPYFLHMSLK